MGARPSKKTRKSRDSASGASEDGSPKNRSYHENDSRPEQKTLTTGASTQEQKSCSRRGAEPKISSAAYNSNANASRSSVATLPAASASGGGAAEMVPRVKDRRFEEDKALGRARGERSAGGKGGVVVAKKHGRRKTSCDGPTSADDEKGSEDGSSVRGSRASMSSASRRSSANASARESTFAFMPMGDLGDALPAREEGKYRVPSSESNRGMTQVERFHRK